MFTTLIIVGQLLVCVCLCVCGEQLLPDPGAVMKESWPRYNIHSYL